ncbi:MAG: PAS domain S-box protein [Sneathiella sp.]|nr:PAS domain S-box protein [Sneathiella sp.]
MKLEKMERFGWASKILVLSCLLGLLPIIVSDTIDPIAAILFGVALAGFTALLLLAWRRPKRDKVDRAALQTKDSLLDAVFDNVSLGIAVFDENFTLLKWNKRYVELVEIDENIFTPETTFQTMLGWNFEKYVNVGDDKEEFVKQAIENIEQRISGTVDRHFANGKIIEIAFDLRREGGIVLMVSDVTASRQAEQSLKENEDRYRRMVELSPDAIVAHKDGFIIYVNEAALRLFKVKSRHDLIGRKISSYFPFDENDASAEYFGRADNADLINNLSAHKTKIIFEDGTKTNVEMEASPLLYGDRRVLQLVIRDISAQIQIEEFLKHAKDEAEYAAQLKGKFLANMSHELRTPLNAVIGFSEVIISQIFGPVGSPKYLEYAHDINASGHHLLDLINDILDFSKIEAGEQKINEEDVEIDVLVNECIRLTQQRAIENDINIKLEFDPFLPQIFADRRMIKQIIINLLSNAVKFTPNGGRIVASVKMLEEDGMKISVSDNGIGIREDDIVKAMTPFVQVDSEKSRKYHGTGLGLPLSKNLAELHEGRLELQSKYGEGTVVSLILPKTRTRRRAA